MVRRALALFDRSTKRRLALAIAGSVVIALAELVSVLAIIPLMQLVTGVATDGGALGFLDDLFGHPSRTTLATIICTVVFAGFLIKGISSLAIRWWLLGFIGRDGARLSADILRYYLSAPVSLLNRRGTADVLRTLNDAVGQVYSQVVGGGMQALIELVTVVLMSTALLIAAPLPTLAVGAYFVIAGALLQRLIRRRTRTAGERTIHSLYVIAQIALRSLGGVKEIKLRNEQDVVVTEYRKARVESAEAMRTTSFLTELPRYALELMFVFGVAMMTVLIYATDPRTGALGTLAMFAVAGFRALPSATRMMASLTLARAGEPSLDIVERELAAARTLHETEHPDAGPVSLTDALELDGVGFRYDDGSTDVLTGVRLRVPHGSSLALVGTSGSGKSTLVDLMLGLNRPTAGSIRADGVDISDRLVGWRSQTAMVPQEVFLFDGSLAENIVFSQNEQPDAARIQEVIEQAQLGDVLTELGPDQSLGENGRRLSGGQRQRVGIARALYRRPRLLVLDEATSALDNETEHRITATMRALHGDVTTVIVAHRLSTVLHCDQVAYLEDGAIADIGSFSELRARCAGFRHLVELGSLETSDADEHPAAALPTRHGMSEQP